MIATPTGPKSVPRDQYHGRTTGPVPEPAATTSDEFLKTIQAYLKEARQWGWCPDEPTAASLERGLEELSQFLDRREDLMLFVDQLVENIEEAYRTGRILHETWVLLKFNLLYLRDRFG
ncbi:MAG: hypothetical protein ACRD1R_16350 [Acidobacteriota bacterium]